MSLTQSPLSATRSLPGDQASSAAQEAASAGDLDRLTALLRRDWPHLMRRPNLLPTLIAATDYASRPELADLGLVATRAPTFMPVVSQLEAGIEATLHRLGTDASIDAESATAMHTLLAMGLRDLGRLDEAKAHIDQARQLGLAQLLAGGGDSAKLGTVTVNNGILSLLRADLLQAGADLQAAHMLPELYPADRAAAAAELALLHALYAEPAAAQHWITAADDVDGGWSEDWLNPGPHTARDLAELLLAVDRLDWSTYDQVLARLNTAGRNFDEHLAISVHAQGRAGLVRGQQKFMLNQIAQLRKNWPRPIPPRSLAARLLTSIQIQLLLSLGEVAEAERLLDPDSKDPYHCLDLSRVLLAAGHPGQAVAALTGDTQLDNGERRTMIDIHLTLATAYQRLRDDEQAVDHVLRAMTLSADPRHISWSLATTSTETLTLAARHEPAIADALSVLDHHLIVRPDHRASRSELHQMTAQERAILRHLADDHTAAQIAAELHLSVYTVRNHIQRIYRRLGVASRREAVAVYKTSTAKTS